MASGLCDGLFMNSTAKGNAMTNRRYYGSNGPMIQDEAAYEAAIRRRIQANARKGKSARWHAEDPTREELVNWLVQQNGAFAQKMRDSYEEWGTLTEGQERAVRKMRDEGDKRRAAMRAEDQKSVHVGTVGKREVFHLTLQNVSAFEGDYGTTWFHRLKDDAGNVVIYKGSNRLALGDRLFERGDKVTVKATVKSHDRRDDIARTFISRPVCMEPSLL